MEPFDSPGAERPQGLFRYTNLASLLHILRNRSVTLLNYALWDDLNDQHYMDFFKRQKGFKSVLALCFTTASETYHHWKVFSPAMDGVRIHFKLPGLVENLETHPQFQMRHVEYSTINDARQQSLDLDKVPFFKRHPYRDEQEFRLLWCDEAESLATKDFTIRLSTIERITLSPWLPPALVSSIKDTINAFDGCEDLDVFASTLRDNKDWKSIINMIAQSNDESQSTP